LRYIDQERQRYNGDDARSEVQLSILSEPSSRSSDSSLSSRFLNSRTSLASVTTSITYSHHPAYESETSPNIFFADRQTANPSILHKRRRANLPKAATNTLRAWLQEHVTNPYPTENEKRMLMNRTGLTISQVNLDPCGRVL